MIYHFGTLTLDSEALVLARGRETVPLARRVIETLLVLVENGGSVVSKEQLMERLWPEGFVEESNLTQNIYVLRRTLRHYGAGDAIETLARRGYRFVLPVSTNAERPQTGSMFRRFAAAVVAACLLLALSAGSARRASALDTEASRVYAMGRYYWNLRSVETMERSRTYFRRVIVMAPRSALGYSGLADADTEIVDMAGISRSATILALVREALSNAAVAVRVDPGSAAAHVSLGMATRLFLNDDRSAEREFHTAIALDSQNAVAHQWLGNLLLSHGDVAGARRELENAASLQPVSTATYAWLARTYYYERRFDEARRYAQEALALEPTRVETTQLLGLVYQAQGRSAAALSEFQRLARIGDASDAQVLMAGVYAAQGDPARSARILRRYERCLNRNPFVARDLIFGYITARQYRTALRDLTHVHFSTPLDRQLFALDPRLDAVRNDARFASFV